jgi:hypothetical protein
MKLTTHQIHTHFVKVFKLKNINSSASSFVRVVDCVLDDKSKLFTSLQKYCCTANFQTIGIMNLSREVKQLSSGCKYCFPSLSSNFDLDLSPEYRTDHTILNFGLEQQNQKLKTRTAAHGLCLDLELELCIRTCRDQRSRNTIKRKELLMGSYEQGN